MLSFGTSETVLIRKVSLLQRLICTIGTSETVLIREVYLCQRCPLREVPLHVTLLQCFSSTCTHRYNLCVQKDYVRFVDLVSSDPNGSSGSSQVQRSHRLTSPPANKQHLSPGPSPPPPCKWKRVYLQSHALEVHWRRGRYSVAPLLRAHRLPVTSISYEGMLSLSTKV